MNSIDFQTQQTESLPMHSAVAREIGESTMKWRTRIILWSLCFLATVGKLQSTPITYTFSGIGSGSLGTNFFSNNPFTITSTANTAQITSSQITNPSATIFKVLNTSANVFVSGIGSGIFSIPTSTVDNQIGRVVFGAPIQNFAVLIVDNPEFRNYDLSTSIGPLTGPPTINSFAQFATFAGNFSLTSVSSVSFQALLQPVPEPSSLSLFVLSITSLGVRLCRKQRGQS